MGIKTEQVSIWRQTYMNVSSFIVMGLWDTTNGKKTRFDYQNKCILVFHIQTWTSVCSSLARKMLLVWTQRAPTRVSVSVDGPDSPAPWTSTSAWACAARMGAPASTHQARTSVYVPLGGPESCATLVICARRMFYCNTKGWRSASHVHLAQGGCRFDSLGGSIL